ncbi:uncharacterized protein LOC130645635 [Hydractinia symbiolongicarpus]|uniref:uncharacterized protein LOC130645635 n=1 Tax=Hydractinia symbiolongicarpus TaxID=13093 RepID=UPI00254D5392|nr:uncharacterized protein LOC130645635 [Hydractinia symbiolongicarpus]
MTDNVRRETDSIREEEEEEEEMWMERLLKLKRNGSLDNIFFDAINPEKNILLTLKSGGAGRVAARVAANIEYHLKRDSKLGKELDEFPSSSQPNAIMRSLNKLFCHQLTFSLRNADILQLYSSQN